MKLINGKKIDFYYLDIEEDIDRLVEIFSSVKLIAVDTETYALNNIYSKASALDCHTSSIRLLQLNYSNCNTPYVVDCLKIGLDKVKYFVDRILADPNKIKVAFNFPFDLKIIKKNFDVWLDNSHCVQIMMQLIGGATGYKWHQSMGYSYKALCRDYLDCNLNKEYGASDWANPNLSLSQLEYAALDVGAPKNSVHSSLLISAYDLFLNLITSKSPHGYGMEIENSIEQDAMREVARMEYTGLPVNPEFIKAFAPAVENELKQAEIKLAKILNLPLVSEIKIIEGIPSIKYKLDLNTQKFLRSPTKLISLIVQSCNYYDELIENLDAKTIEIIITNLKQNLVKEPSSKIEITKDLTLFQELLELKKIQKMLDKDWLHLINPVTKCIHAGYRTIGTSTGRMSSSGSIFGIRFNAQQIPRKKIVIDIDSNIDNIFVSKSKIL